MYQYQSTSTQQTCINTPARVQYASPNAMVINRSDSPYTQPAQPFISSEYPLEPPFLLHEKSAFTMDVYSSTQQQQELKEDTVQMMQSTSAPAQFAPNPTSLNRNATGLPSSLQTGIESLAGMSMDHVNVHYNSAKPAQLRALAYAQGSEIYLGPGQEQHLPHEAWHLVQQAQGRVKPTMQMKGSAVNDDESLEHEADVMGMKAAMTSPRTEDKPLQRGIAELPSPIQGKGIIQRAIAIEAESYDNWKIQGKQNAGDNWGLIKNTKEPLGSKDKVSITSDNGNLEFVTQPMTEEKEVDGAFTQMTNTLTTLAAASPVEINDFSQEVAGLNWISQAGYTEYKLKAATKKQGDPEKAPFLPQATIDIPFSSFNTYLKQFADEGNAALMGNSFVDTSNYILNNAGSFIPKGLLPEADGFLKMVLMALADAYNFPGKEDPKYAFATMPRNRFSEMYTAADAASGGELARVFPNFANEVLKIRASSPMLFPNKYKSDSGIVDGPTVEEWFDSIVTPQVMEGTHTGRQSDLLSPPPGQRTKLEGRAPTILREALSLSSSFATL